MEQTGVHPGYYLQLALSNVGRVDFEEERESLIADFTLMGRSAADAAQEIGL
jgi:hypothetical protein